MACMAGAPVKVKSGMYMHEPDRNPKHRLRSNCNGTSGLPRSTDTTQPKSHFRLNYVNVMTCAVHIHCSSQALRCCILFEA